MPRSRLPLVFALIAASLALPSRADDSRYQDYPVGSRAMVLGGAFVALSDDPSGLTYNPAGLCDMRKLNVNVSASLYGIERTTRSDSTLLNGNTFSLATLAALNVIPGEAGFVKGFGQVDGRGSRWAIGFDVTVPSFRTYGLDQTDPYRVHTRIVDRTFDIAVGGAYRWDDMLNFGVSLHGVARLFDEQESALVADTSTPPNVASYTANTRFENVNLVLELGAKVRLDEGKWLLGASLGLPGVGVYSGGSISIQDITANPNATNTPRTSVNLYETDQVDNHTPVPLVIRAGAARIQPGQWTLSGQLTLHAGATYNRFDAPADIASRLRIQDRVERSPVFDVNVGGEYLINRDWSVAAGLFTSNSGAQSLQVRSDGSLDPASSHLEKVSLIGGTATLGLLGDHSISRLGVSFSYGTGKDAVADDPTGIDNASGYTQASVKQLFLYVFLASTFRY